MKKVISLILVLTLALSLCACGSEAEAEGTTAPGQTQPEQETTAPATAAPETTAPEAAPAGDDYVFTYNGVDIVMNAPAADIIAALGEPKSYSEETSCAFEGLDKTWFFGSFYLQTYPMEDVDYVYCLWLVDDSVETPEGIYIGASQAEVEAAYGAENYNGTNAYIIDGENTRLTVILENGVVTSIQYDAQI